MTVAKLRPSRLSDQLETLNGDVDLTSLNLGVQHQASFPLLEAVTAASITRTIEGASTLTIQALDRDRALLNSGYLANKLDVEIDGLWFRLRSWAKTGESLELTFEDREVAVLRSWPPASQDPTKVYRVWPAGKFGLRTRFMFARQLIKDVEHILPIRFVCPQMSDKAADPTNNPAKTAHDRSYGFADVNTVTVKHVKADKDQLANIKAVLDEGVALGARRKVLVTAVMVATQESSFRTTATAHSHNGDQVGIFQQAASQGWPATRDPTIDAAAFFKAAISDDQKNPNIAYWELGEDVQVSGQGLLYKQWFNEAQNTVASYAGDDGSLVKSGGVVWAPADGLPNDPNKGQFVRGRLESVASAIRQKKTIVQVVQGSRVVNKVVVREDNWTCLQRLAAEIGFRCFCVSGTVYFVSDEKLFRSNVLMTLSEDDDGIDSIDPDFTQGAQNAQVTVTGRADRWKAPPGSVVALTDMGPANGRWLNTTVERSLFDTAVTITLKKPQPVLPESSAPEHGAGQQSGETPWKQPGKRDVPPASATSGPVKGPTGSAQQLLNLLGKTPGWRDDRSGQEADQIRSIAQGIQVTNRGGQKVWIDGRVIRVLLWLIEDNGYGVGTFAMCSDHSYHTSEGRVSAHPAGRAVDIDSMDSGGSGWAYIGQSDSRNYGNVIGMMNLLRAAPGDLLPKQLICGGYGGIRNAEITALSLPSGDYYDSKTLGEHTNHIHVGY